jgi:membrane associated rhomboid family serine protease
MTGFLTATPAAFFILLITVLTSVVAIMYDTTLIGKFIFHPYSVIREKRYSTFFTSGLIHADYSHLAFNMLTFFFFGFALEKMMGSIPFLFLYLISLATSEIGTLIKHKDNNSYYSLGASGAVSAVLFSYILYSPLSKIYLFFIPIGIPAWLFGPIYLAYCVYAAKKSSDHINHDAHFYGAISGIILTIIFNPSIISSFINQF